MVYAGWENLLFKSNIPLPLSSCLHFSNSGSGSSDSIRQHILRIVTESAERLTAHKNQGPDFPGYVWNYGLALKHALKSQLQ